LNSHQLPPFGRQRHGKHHHNQEKRWKKIPASSWKILFYTVAIGIAAVLAVEVVCTRFDVLIVVSLLLLAVLFNSWLLNPFARSNSARRRYLEQPAQQPIDEMTKHLQRGDTPILGEDGEIYFQKEPKQTIQSNKD